MKRSLWIASGILALPILAGVVFLIVNRQGNDMTPQEAKQHVFDFVESTVAHVAPGRSATLEDAEGTPGSCHDALGGMTDQTSRDYSWVIGNVDDALAEQIVARTDQLWKERGLRVRQDNQDPGVSTVIASDEDRDFGYSLTANRNEGTVFVGGQTPCLDEGSA